MYDYFLGGQDNFEADRVAAEGAIKTFPKTAESARAARAFLRQVVWFLASEAGIRQFLDIGAEPAAAALWGGVARKPA